MFGVLNEVSGAGFLTSDLVKPIADNAQADLTILLPVGIGLMSIMIGVSLIPRIVYKFL